MPKCPSFLTANKALGLKYPATNIKRNIKKSKTKLILLELTLSSILPNYY